MSTAISVTSPLVRAEGRIAWEETGAHCYWPATHFTVRFRGTSLSACLTSWVMSCVNSLGVVCDGRLSMLPLKPCDDGVRRTLLLADSLAPEAVHTLILFKRQDDYHHFILHGFETDGSFAGPAPLPALKLEFYGDSVTAGQVVEATDYTGRCDPPGHDGAMDNPWWSYAWQTARMLDARIVTAAQGGIAVFPGTGWFHWPDTIGMDTTWDRLCYFPEAGELTGWDFSRYTPDVVVFAIGQNDQHDTASDTNCLTVADPAYRAKWKAAYKAIAAGVASHYPAATKYVFITTVLMHDPVWDEAITECARELREERGMQTYRFLFSRNGSATPGHPRISEQTEMARELTAFLRGIL